MRTDNSDGWHVQDFIDESELNVPYDDPWDPLSLASPNPSNPDSLLPQPSRATVTGEENHSSLLNGDIAESSAFWTTEAFEDQADIPPEWFEADFDGESDEESFEEPVPTAEFDPELSQELYQEPDFSPATADLRAEQ